MARRARRALLVLALLGILAGIRGPLHRETFRLPLTNDDAIPLLIARGVLRGELSTTLWNQPYNGTLDSYLLAPGLLLVSPHALFRGYEALAALLLVLLVGRLGLRLEGEAAGWIAAILAACGTPYMALMAATGPTPNFLVPLLAGWLLLAAPRHLGSDRPARLAASFGWGLLAGLAIWDTALAVPAFAGIGIGLLLAGARPRPRTLLGLAAGLAVGLVPMVLARVIGAAGASSVNALRPRWLWAAGLADLARASAGLVGLTIPEVVDGPEHLALALPWQLALAAGLALAVGLGAARRRALPLLGWGLLLAGAFALSRRTSGSEIRYLYGLVVPVLALAGAGLARAGRRSPSAAGALLVGILLSWVAGQWSLARLWRDPSHATRVWQVPPLDPVLDTLGRAGVRSAYASLQFAGRLQLESGGAILASQAFNERIPGDPLRYRDEVDLDPRAAWVLSPHLSRGMPRAGGFRALLEESGGTWSEDHAGDFVIFRRFRPPYDEAREVPVGETTVLDTDGDRLPDAVLDRDPDTGWTASSGLGAGRGLVVRLDPPRRLDALVLLVDPASSLLAVPWVAEAEGRLVARGPVSYGLQWVNGGPRMGRQALLAVVLGGIRTGELRLLFQAEGPPLHVAEVFLYGPDEPARLDGGRAAAQAALRAARSGDWDRAVRLYGEAAREAPGRASYDAALFRARWRAAHRRWLDVESLGDGGRPLVSRR